MRGKLLEYILSQPLMTTLEAAMIGASIAERIDPPEAVETRKSMPMDRAEGGLVRRGSVAILPIMGPIARYSSFISDICGYTTIDTLAKDAQTAADDMSIRAVVQHIDSPGGEITGIAETASIFAEIAKRKPVVAYIGGAGASAAYYLAAPASEIVIGSQALVGSIGVIQGWVERDPRPGTREYTFIASQSPNKRPDPETEEGKAQIQQVVNDLAAVFVADVARYRGVSAEHVISEFGGGGVLVGQKAVDAGLADRVGSLESVIAELQAGAVPTRRKIQSKKGAKASSRGDKSMAWKWLHKQRADGSVETRKVEMSEDHDDDAPPPVVFQAPASQAAPTSHASKADPVTTPADDAEKIQLRAQLAAAKAETYKARAESAYNALATAKKAIPAEKSKMVANMIRDQIDDDTSPIEGTKRFDARIAEYEERLPHTLDVSMIDASATAPSDEEIVRAGGRPSADRRPANAPTPVGANPSPDRMEFLAGLLAESGGVDVRGQFKNAN